MSYAALEKIAENLRPLLPIVPESDGHRIDARRTLEITLAKAGYHYHVESVADLQQFAAYTIPDEQLIVLREDVFDGLIDENVFSRSTVIHELSHIVLKHAVTLQRGPVGKHKFYEDSEWQAKALTAAVMMPIAACRAVSSSFDLAQLSGTSEQAARYRIERLAKDKIIAPKTPFSGLFDLSWGGPP
jgi:hypothetical protein